MMKILYITEISMQSDIGGGGDNARKAYDAVKKYCTDKGCAFGVISLNDHLPETLPVNLRKNKMLDMLARILGHSNYLALFRFRIMAAVNQFQPDVMILGRSRYGFLAKAVKRQLPECRVITVFENVELDYIEAHLGGSGILSRMKRQLEGVAVRRDEGDSVTYSDACVFLQNRDWNRVNEIYHQAVKQYCVIPICLKNRPPLVLRLPVKTLVFTGRLCYHSNVEAVEWLLDHVVPFYPDVSFIIGGTRPGKGLTERIKRYDNVKFYSDFKDIADIVPIGSLFLSPTFHGAGMKVKIAEALSLGLPIVGTEESFVGYEDIMALDGIFLANDIDAFKAAIDQYLGMSDSDLEEIARQNKEAFLKYYEYGRAQRAYQELLDSVLA